MPVRAPVLAKGTLTGSEGQRESALTVEARDLPNSEGRMWLDMIVNMKERQKQKWAFEKKLKAAEETTPRREVLLTVGDFSVVVLDDDDDADFGPHIVESRRSLQATNGFEAGFQNVGARPTETIADPKGLINNDAPNTRDRGLVGEGGQADELR